MTTPLLTIDQAAEQLGMSRGYVKKVIRESKLRTVRLGRAVRVEPSDFQDFIDRHKSTVDDSVDAVSHRGGSPVSGGVLQVTEKTLGFRR